MNRRDLLAASAASAAGLAIPSFGAFAQSPFPSKPVTLVVPFAPGGNLDVVARAVSPALGKLFGQTVIVDNRAGAGGAIGASFVGAAPADGYTILVSTPNAIVVVPKITRTSYQLATFAPVGMVAATPLAVMVNGKSRFKDVAALLAEAKAKPGSLTTGHSGLGTTNHVAILQLEEAAGVELNVVPYKGSGPALVDLISGQIDMVVDQLSSSMTHIQSGALRVLAVMSKDRDPTLPHTPTLREAGLKDFDATTSTGLLVPAATPKPVIDAINAALGKALADPEVKKRLDVLGSPAHPSTSATWQQLLAAEDAKAAVLVKKGRLKAD